MIIRKKTKVVRIGGKKIGGTNPVLVQSMANTKTEDLKLTVKQIHQLEKAGCEIVRVAVHSLEAAKNLKQIKKEISIPLVADIQFNYQWAIESARGGADKIRINPGNIGSKEKIREVVEACKSFGLPIRIGINHGSLEQDFFSKYGRFGTAKVMLESVSRQIQILENLHFYNIVVSLKSSSVEETIDACRLFSQRFSYPQHLGITEAGTFLPGVVKSSIGIGTLLGEGIGDTIRISLTDNPVEEVKTGWEILKALNLRQKGPNLISCPTCGRTEIDLIGLAKKVEEILEGVEKPITVAVMGCAVNGPGEAREADIGIAGGKKMAVIFSKGKIIKSVKESGILPAFKKELTKLLRGSSFRKKGGQKGKKL